MSCDDGYHSVTQDQFATISSVKRDVPGDCWCVDCKRPVAAWWNQGRPTPIADNT